MGRGDGMRRKGEGEEGEGKEGEGETGRGEGEWQRGGEKGSER